MGNGVKALIAAAGFLYGVVLVFHALWWCAEGPVFTMPIAGSPLNLGWVIVRAGNIQSEMARALAVIFPLFVAPFCWAWLAVFAACARNQIRRTVVIWTLLAHYAGIGAWFALIGSDLLTPFHDTLMTVYSTVLLIFYAAGQSLLWWAMIRARRPELRIA